MQLVPAHGEQIHLILLRAKNHLSIRLDGIRMEKAIGIFPFNHLPNRMNILYCPHFIVDRHDTDKNRFFCNRLFQIAKRNMSFLIDRKNRNRKTLSL